MLQHTLLFGSPEQGTHRIADPALGLCAFLVVDSTRRGPAFGGIRRRAYDNEAAARQDAARLARAMTQKCALANLPAGGAKLTVMDHPGLKVRESYRAIGRFVESLEGRYVCGPDVGTDTRALDEVRRETSHVNPEGNDAARSTALGVAAALRGAMRHAFDTRSFAGRQFFVQGLGAVGTALSAELLAGGGRVCACDIDESRHAFARARGIELVDPQEPYGVGVDVWVPCAMGDILDGVDLDAVRASAICGSANNQIGTERIHYALAERGVAVVPDVVSSAGAVIEGVLTVLGGPEGRGEAQAAIANMEDTVFEILQEARADRPSVVVARELADSRLKRP